MVSAGGVVYRQVDGRFEAVLCGQSSKATGDGEKPGDDSPVEDFRWCLAKGTPDPGETLEETALREVQEETGLEVEIDTPIGTIDYWFAARDAEVRFHKTVYFYLMSFIGGHTDLHDPEFDVVRWFPLDDAFKMLAYPNEVEVFQRALDVISQRKGDC